MSRGTACGDLNAQSLLTLFAARGDGGGLGVRFISLLYAKRHLKALGRVVSRRGENERSTHVSHFASLSWFRNGWSNYLRMGRRGQVLQGRGSLIFL